MRQLNSVGGAQRVVTEDVTAIFGQFVMSEKSGKLIAMSYDMQARGWDVWQLAGVEGVAATADSRWNGVSAD
jgi:hypothetical protein